MTHDSDEFDLASSTGVDPEESSLVGEVPTEDAESLEREPNFAEKLQAALDQLDPLGRVEAVLFLAREPLNSRKISQLAGLEDGTRARSVVKQLNQQYAKTGRSFQVKQVAGGFQLRTRPMFSDWIRKSGQSTNSHRLSGPVMETLSVVAYRQPVLKAEVEAVRGVSCGELLRQLLDRGLVRISGRSEELGNPFLYGTTRKFLEVFGLPSIESLPRADKLRGKGLPNWSLTQDEVTEPESQNPPNSESYPLDELEPNSQNTVDSDTSTNQLPQEDPKEE